MIGIEVITGGLFMEILGLQPKDINKNIYNTNKIRVFLFINYFPLWKIFYSILTI
jgi:hypothetical protein